MKDNCQFCRGTKGGMRGNENIVGKIVCCDDCSVLATRIVDNTTSKIAKWILTSAELPTESDPLIYLAGAIKNKNWNVLPWPSHYICYLCRKEDEHTTNRAVIRIFAGVQGGGFATCDRHTGQAEVSAIRGLTRDDVEVGYEIKGFRVIEDEFGGPALGDQLWVVAKIKKSSDA